ncbi:HD domain-containing protein [Alcanivorax sp. 1008]|uniref:HD domain-containing protein n=1 Tax=Alcanivorax sp. 1008 TaxID=2816853 RepID=UPI001E074115|nr:HD domain-containing protein [Alcanivorax sp. 1008]MCC1495946.1 HD domain-containing protein [Alcanivorax sp. 1008]
MEIERDIPLVEEILGSFKRVIGEDYNAYKNHVYRVINLCYSLSQLDPVGKEKVQIAACFHDIGIWTKKTLDYLPPSETAASDYLRATGRDVWVPEICEMVEMHHRIRSCSDCRFPLVESFRRADIADFSLGLVPMGIDREVISRVKAEFPNSGFHKRLAQLATMWIVRHPLNPLPMFRG